LREWPAATMSFLMEVLGEQKKSLPRKLQGDSPKKLVAPGRPHGKTIRMPVRPGWNRQGHVKAPSRLVSRTVQRFFHECQPQSRDPTSPYDGPRISSRTTPRRACRAAQHPWGTESLRAVYPGPSASLRKPRVYLLRKLVGEDVDPLWMAGGLGQQFRRPFRHPAPRRPFAV